MADEASLRIVLEGDDAGAQPRGGRPPQQQGGPPSPSLRPAGKKEVEPETVFDAFLKVAEKLRSVLTGFFGKLGSTTLDLARSFNEVGKASTTALQKVPLVYPAPVAPTVVPAAQVPFVLPAPKPIASKPSPSTPSIPGGVMAGGEWFPGGPQRPPLLSGGGVMAGGEWFPGGPQPPPPRPTPPTSPLTPVPGASRPQLPTQTFGGVAAQNIAGNMPKMATGGMAGSVGANLAAAAGPIGIALAVVEVIKGLRDAATGAIRGIGDFAATMISANHDVSANMSAFGGVVGETSDKLFYLSPVLSSFGSVVGAVIQSFGKVMSAIDQNVERYAGFNPQIAQAQAQAELRHVFGEFRRASEVSTDLTRYIAARSELQQRFEDTKVRILSAILPTVLGFMSLAQQALPVLESMAALLSGLASIIPFMGQQQNNQLNELNQILQQMQQAGLDFPGNLVMQGGFPFTGNAGAQAGGGASPFPPMP